MFPALHLSKLGLREIARSGKDCAITLISAAGAGLITAATVVVKLWMAKLPLPLFAAALLLALNFVLSFCTMQWLGFRLATKQSPLFGAALGRLRRSLRRQARAEDPLIAQWRKGMISYQRMNERWKLRFDRQRALFAFWRQELAYTLRTQALSAAGNLISVIGAALVFHLVIQWLQGTPFFSPGAAKAALESFDPLSSASLPYAALTGVLLWVCASFGAAIAHRLRPFSKSLSGLLSNVLLGAMLALVPMLGKWFGLPIDVRHFTLSGGTVTIAALSLGLQNALNAGLLAAAVGVVIIGALNFSVSFALAFASCFYQRIRTRALAS